MSEDNLIHFADHLGRLKARKPPARPESRDADRSKTSEAILAKLRQTKRLKRSDQEIIAVNLGRLLERLDEHPKALARKLLGPGRSKRARYIRFSNEPVDADARLAGSGGTFAGIVDELIEEKTRKGFERVRARLSTIHEVLDGTSFRPTTRPVLTTDGSDAALLVRQMDSILDVFFRAAQLTEYFDLISKFCIGPTRWSMEAALREKLLHLDPTGHVNDLFSWNTLFDDGELQPYIPWWAPKCVIGHLYIPFETKVFRYPESEFEKLKAAADGQPLSQDWWINRDCTYSIGDLITDERTSMKVVHHRLPVWLVILPAEDDRICACLFVSVHYDDDIQIEQCVSEETGDSYYSHVNATTPAFVDRVGKALEDDDLYFCDDPYNEYTDFHVCIGNDSVKVIGRGLDEDVANFMTEFFTATVDDELPPWLQPQPVQLLLKLNAEAPIATRMALEAREFLNFNNTYLNKKFDSLFRPALHDPIEMPTPFRNNSIAGYLMRNFAYSKEPESIFGALQKDALSKLAATKKEVQSELAKFHQKFRDRFND